MRRHVVNLDVYETGRRQGSPMLIRCVEIRDGPTIKPFVQQTLAGSVTRASRAHVFSDDQSATGPQ